ncbi:MAG: AraC family transcriptional regulator, partial [Lachnospiraceae bacterium]|nr:AraC family transcriptional regulator [Lachnospiraceae bacterium]
FIDKLKERLFYYHNATDIPLKLLTKEGETVQSFSGEFPYCSVVREACGERAFCERMHREGVELATELDDGYIFSWPAGLVHFIGPVKKDGERAYSVIAGPIAMDYPDISVVDGLIRGYGLTIDLRQKLYAALNAIPIVEPVRIQHLSKLLYALISDLPDDGSEEEDDPVPENLSEASVSIPIIQKAVAYIDEHFQEDMRLENVAAFVGLNPSYFSSIFKKELKISFSNYLTQKRIEEACGLLLRSNLSLSDIAYEVGFENQSYFSHSFRRHTGMSPKEYRKSQIPYSSGR